MGAALLLLSLYVTPLFRFLLRSAYVERSRIYALTPMPSGRTHLRNQAPRARKGHNTLSRGF